jgi:hypothetical protein
MNNNDRHRENFNDRFRNTGLNEMQINMKYEVLLREQEMYQALLREQEMYSIGSGGLIDNTINNYVENDYVENYFE